MKIVRVIPLSRGIQKESLSYFSSLPIAIGTLVSVPIAKRHIVALVIECEDAVYEKQALKNSSYTLKKIKSIVGPSFISLEFLELARVLHYYYVASTGAILTSLIPSIYLKRANTLQIGAAETEKKLLLRTERLLLQASLEERLGHYKTLIRESFARKQSVYICAPTIFDITVLHEQLQKGIEPYTFMLHNSVSDKQLLAFYNKIMDEKHPIVIIGTGSFLSIPRKDIKTIIIESESSEAYVGLARPYVDMRVVAETYAVIMKAKIIFADTILRIETLHRLETHEATEYAPISMRLPGVTMFDVIHMKDQKNKDGFKNISVQARTAMVNSIERGEHSFIFTLRKNYAPITICSDCGQRVGCTKCGQSLILKQSKDALSEQRIFYCSHCQSIETTERTCTYCGNWQLVPLGIGIERVVEEVKEIFAKVPVFILSKDTVHSNKEAYELVEQYYKTPGSILVGTEMALFYLSTPVAITLITSFDSLFSIPSFNMNEKILRLSSKVRQLATKHTFVQTRTKQENIYQELMHGMYADFYRSEIRDREKYKYPPFASLIRIQYGGNEEERNAVHAMLTNFLANEKHYFFSGYSSNKKMPVETCLVKLSRECWNINYLTEKNEFDFTLYEKLACLPPSVSIHVDSDVLL